MTTAAVLSTAGLPQTIADGAEDCECHHHAVIAPASGQFPPCKFSEQPCIYDTPLPFGTYPDKYVRKMDPTVLMKLDGFAIERGADVSATTWDPGSSWITHLCPSALWKVVVDSQWALKTEVCFSCNTEIPPGVIALWKMHNWDELKDIANEPEIELDLMGDYAGLSVTGIKYREVFSDSSPFRAHSTITAQDLMADLCV